jgi:hypothetical protein
MSIAEEAWNKTRGENPEYRFTGPEFRGRLDMAVSEVRNDQSSGIAGLEGFEEEVKSLVAKEKEDAKSGKQPEGEPQTPERALQNAAAAGARVEAGEEQSPSFPSAARPLAAEAPGNLPAPGEKVDVKAEGSVRSGSAATAPAPSASKGASGGSKKSASGSAAKAGGSKKAAKKAGK